MSKGSTRPRSIGIWSKLGPHELGADPHPDAVADRRERAGVDDLSREARGEPLREPAREREAVDDERRVRVHRLEELARQPRGMDRHRVADAGLLLAERPLELLADAGDLGEPGAAAPLHALGGGELAQLAEDEL